MATQERLFNTTGEWQRVIDVPLGEEYRVIAKESSYYNRISLTEGDVLLYRVSSELSVILLATGEELCNTFQGEDDFSGDTTTTIETPCRVWLFHECMGTVKEVDRGLWRGREWGATCLQLVTGENGSICENSVYKEIKSPPEGTIYTHIKAENVGKLPLGFMQEQEPLER